MTFPEQLRAERARLGINQTKLAEILEVSDECVSKWERAVSEPSRIAQEGALSRLSKIKTPRDYILYEPSR